MPSAGNPIVRARVEKDFKAACDQKAERIGIDLSAVIRDALAQFVNESDEETLKRLGHLVAGVATP